MPGVTPPHSPTISAVAPLPGRSDGAASEQPPTFQFIRDFFIDHKVKIFLTGLAAILLGMGLIILDIATGGGTLPFTGHLTIGLFSYGGAAVLTGVTAKILSGEDAAGKPVKGKSDAPKKRRAGGKRMIRRYLQRRLHHEKIALPAGSGQAGSGIPAPGITQPRARAASRDSVSSCPWLRPA